MAENPTNAASVPRIEFVDGTTEVSRDIRVRDNGWVVVQGMDESIEPAGMVTTLRLYSPWSVRAVIYQEAEANG